MGTWRSDSETWTCGPWSLARRGAELADLAYRGRPVLRAIRAVARDQDWHTLEWTVEVRADDAAFTLGLRAGPLSGTLAVRGTGDDLTVELDLEAAAPFSTNRTGLVALHPPRLAGTALRAVHSDGSSEDTAFPAAVGPHQPVLDIAALAWEHDGLAVEAAFAGEVFEMEDQRNWTDASYKTYSRPLALPIPYDLVPGERVRQSITLRAKELGPAAPEPDETRIVLAPGGAFPETALGAATGPDPEPVPAPLGATVLVELDLWTPNWPAALERAASAGLPLDVRVIARPGADLDLLAARLRPHWIARVGLFDPDTHLTADLDALRAALDRAGLRPPLVAGTRAHFTELNRNPDAVRPDADAIAFSSTPLFHESSAEQLLEAVAVQRTVALQAAALGKPVHIGPITLRPRFDNVATSSTLASPRPDLAAGYGPEFTGAGDPRQADDPLAAWTIAAAAALAVPGVAGLTWFEEWGPRGIRSAAGDPYPVAAVLETLAAMAPGELLWGDSPDGLVWALGSRTAGRTRFAAANLDRRPRAFTVAFGSEELRLVLGPLGWAAVD
ncbi:hypothetical protein AB0A73_06075 [Glycomyces sp. NPDC047369]